MTTWLQRILGRPRPDPLTHGDGEHLRLARASDTSAILANIRRGLVLLAEGLSNAPQPWKDTYSNDLAAVACLGRAYRQVRSAVLLAHFGYYQETQAVLRGAVEAGGLARIVAHDPPMAEKWLRQRDWFPDRVVRARLAEEHAQLSSKLYGELSKWTHPTAEPCLMGLAREPSGYFVRLGSTFNSEWFDYSLRLTLDVTVWLCFAFRNCAVTPLVLPPTWLKELADLAKDANPQTDWSHVQRMKDAIEERWMSVADRTGTAADLELALQGPQATANVLKRLGIEPLDPDDFQVGQPGIASNETDDIQ